MPKKWFVCPDGESIEIKDCMEKCRLASRCAPIPFLKMAGEWRPWRGHASVTMLERCLRMRWLQERVDFSETPDGSAFRIIGTRGHAALEDYGQGQLATEQYMELDGLRGVTDLVEEDNGTRTLWDYKVVGSFSVAKMLGICEVGTKDILDDDGNPVILSRGKNAGSVKTEKVYGIDPRKADISDYQLQPNVYKLAWEALHPDLQIDALKIFAIVRDGGLYLSKGRGVLRNTMSSTFPLCRKLRFVISRCGARWKSKRAWLRM
jgi:hypothetical protein